MKRPPLLGRWLSSLLIGEGGDIVRGDLEESYHRRSTRRSRAYFADLSKTLVAWWSPAAIARRRRHARAKGGPMGSGIGKDIRDVLRQIVRRPGFALTVIVTLGLGIGATTTIYSIVDAIVVRSLPYPHADRLVVAGVTSPGREWRTDASGLQRLVRTSGANGTDWKTRVHAFEQVVLVEAVQQGQQLQGGEMEIVQHAAVGEGFFELFGVRPAVGRVFNDDDFAGRNGRVQMLSYGAWVRRYGGDPAAVTGSIVGVLPPGFEQPETLGKQEIEFWTALNPNDRRYTDRRRGNVTVFARLRPGVSIDAARAEMASIQAAIAKDFPEGNLSPDGRSNGAGVNGLQADIVGGSERTLWVFAAAAAFLLLIAGLNAANLLLVRGLDRGREIGLRQALGAGRGRLIRGQLSESLILTLLASAFGILLAYAGVQAFLVVGPTFLPRMGSIAVNWRVLAATTTLSVGVGLAVGLLPALRLAGHDVAVTLRRSESGTSTTSGAYLRRGIVVVQLALAVLLSVGAGLLISSYVRLRGVNPGFDPRGLTVATVSLKKEAGHVDALWIDWNELREQVASVAGLKSVAISSNVPFRSRSWDPTVLLPGDPANVRRAGINGVAITPDFFDAMGMTLRSGRAFDRRETSTSAPVAIVNDAFVREYLPGRDAVGLSIRLRGATSEVGAPMEIVGVVANAIEMRVEDGWLPALYVPHTQGGGISGLVTVVVRSDRSPQDLGPALRRAIRGFTPVPLIDLTVMEERIGVLQSGPRFNALLVGTFATLAILLAAVGLYGTMAHSVGRRQRELGIRMAIGADARSIFRMVLREGAVMSAIGLAAGLAASIALTRFLRSFLFEVDTLDPAALAAAAVMLALVVLAAVLRPAIVAMRVDPLRSLRAE